jgi:hypothetical protein
LWSPTSPPQYLLPATYLQCNPFGESASTQVGISCNTYKAFDEDFTKSAFEFIDAGFECLEDERIAGSVEIFRKICRTILNFVEPYY